MQLAAGKREKNTEDGVHLALVKDGEQWVDYLDRHSLEIQDLMKLTRNKRRFYQQGIRAATLIRSIS